MIGNLELAEGQLREAITIAKRLDGIERYVYEEPYLLQRLCTVLRLRGDQDGAEAAILNAIELAQSRFGDD